MEARQDAMFRDPKWFVHARDLTVPSSRTGNRTQGGDPYIGKFWHAVWQAWWKETPIRGHRIMRPEGSVRGAAGVYNTVQGVRSASPTLPAYYAAHVHDGPTGYGVWCGDRLIEDGLCARVARARAASYTASLDA